VVKQALVDLSDAHDTSCLDATYALFFFGVPNSGMEIGAIKLMVRDQPNESFVHNLGPDSFPLRGLGRKFDDLFAERYNDAQMISFYELKPCQASVWVSTLSIAFYVTNCVSE
jgi:hypothetical protein